MGLAQITPSADLEAAIASVSVPFRALVPGPLKIKDISSSPLLLERGCPSPVCGKQAQWQQEEVGSVVLAQKNWAAGMFRSLSRERSSVRSQRSSEASHPRWVVNDVGSSASFHSFTQGAETSHTLVRNFCQDFGFTFGLKLFVPIRIPTVQGVISLSSSCSC